MKLEEQREIAKEIYKKHHIDVLKWETGLMCDAQSDCARSYFDFEDSLSIANKEIRYALNLSAVCLISGGLDSATVLGILLNEGYKVLPVTLNYGQLHDRELQSARDVIAHYAQQYEGRLLPAEEFELGFLRKIGGSALTESGLTVPSGRDEKEMSSEIPVTYVPGRNTIFIAIGLSIAEVYKADILAIGVNALDYSGYPDCRPEYIESFNMLARLSSKRAVEGRPTRIYTPLLHLTKADIIKKGTELGVPYHLTWSCYKGGNDPCGECDSCKLRAKGFEAAGKSDPAL